MQRGGQDYDSYGAREAFRGSEDLGSGKYEYSWSRLRYSMAGAGGGGYWIRLPWQMVSRDYPKADRQFLIALRRLTRINARPTEQVVDLNSDDIFNFPWVYAVQVQGWTFNEQQARRLREYLLKGGFLMVDDFHGTEDWQTFMSGMLMVFPGSSCRGTNRTTMKFFTCSMTWANDFRSSGSNT